MDHEGIRKAVWESYLILETPCPPGRGFLMCSVKYDGFQKSIPHPYLNISAKKSRIISHDRRSAFSS
jgi:hypothetical protein